jgi:hypothetical protein
VYLMPRMRIVRGRDVLLPEPTRQRNNEQFMKMLHEAFFDGTELKPFVASDKQAYGNALADFITAVLNFHDPMDPHLKANFAAMPHNARLGGGNKVDENGRYLRGDAWALGTIKVNPVERDGRKVLAFTSPPIDGFAGSVAANPAGTRYRSVAPPAFRPGSSSYIFGWEKFVNKDDGFLSLPVERDGEWSASNIDNLFVSNSYKRWQTQELGLADPRRRIFEERGMSCFQCHVRNFDEGGYLNQAVANPSQGNDFGSTARVGTVFFVVVPTPDEGRSGYLALVEQEQVASLRGAIRDYLGLRINIPSPLAEDWPYDTRVGKH